MAIEEAVYSLQRNVEDGDSTAQLILETYCREVEMDLERALHWYHKSAEAGDSLAQCTLLARAYSAGQLIEASDFTPQLILENYGREVEMDLERALHWYQRSAEAGNSNAQF